MVGLCLILIVFICLSSWIPFLNPDVLAFSLHEKCLQFSSFQSETADIYKAIVCGRRLPEGLIKQTFVKSGLIHLMVVSGAHLLFLERLWKNIHLPFFRTGGILFLLILYALTANLHPPVLRALFSFLLLKINRSCKLFWSSSLITHISGILCLIYSPGWARSPSLQLSWLASLAQNISSSRLNKSLLTYLIVLPVCNRWRFLHPFTVFINWIVAPFIGSVLFPCSLLAVFFHPIRPVTDRLWEISLKALIFLQDFIPHYHFIKWHVPERGMWIYILAVFVIVEVFSVQGKRRKVSPEKS